MSSISKNPSNVSCLSDVLTLWLNRSPDDEDKRDYANFEALMKALRPFDVKLDLQREGTYFAH